jgi:dTDP-4-dehydrorhamnose reductase
LIARAPRVVPIATSDYPTAAKRPAYSCLDVSRIESDFGIRMPTWDEGLSGVLHSVQRVASH